MSTHILELSQSLLYFISRTDKELTKFQCVLPFVLLLSFILMPNMLKAQKIILKQKQPIYHLTFSRLFIALLPSCYIKINAYHY